jgi:D-3-phosphoglycerate dehydrogenase
MNMSVKVNCLNPIAKVGLDIFTDDYVISDDFQSADAVLVRSASMHDKEFSENLLAIARAGAGYNNIPFESCGEKGIVVFNTPGANANGVKDLFVAGLMLTARDIAGGMNWVRENKDDPEISVKMEKAKKQFAGTEVRGKKLGVIGLGAIGVLAANIGNRLGMDVYGVDPYLSVEHALNMSRDVTMVKTYDEIYNICDYITIHAPLNDETKEMLNKDAFEKMNGTVIINLARDVLVNDDDMKEALESGKVRKYVTDFPNAKTANMEGVIATPHLGASTEESEDNCAIMAVNEIRDFIENGSIINSVNYPTCDVGPVSTKSRITVMHKNVPKMLTQFTGIFSEEGINIENMMNKSRENYAYSVFDIKAEVPETFIERLNAIDGVIRVRIIEN